jgi:hypothetical protein
MQNPKPADPSNSKEKGDVAPQTKGEIPDPPGSLKPFRALGTEELPEHAMDAAELRIEVWRFKAIARHSIPVEYQYMIQGQDAETLNAKALSLAGLLARAK